MCIYIIEIIIRVIFGSKLRKGKELYNDKMKHWRKQILFGGVYVEIETYNYKLS